MRLQTLLRWYLRVVVVMVFGLINVIYVNAPFPSGFVWFMCGVSNGILVLLYRFT